MDQNSIVQAFVAPGDIVTSTVECSWQDEFRILGLVEHPNWDLENNFQKIGQISPESREFVILILEGRAPILEPKDLDLTQVIPIVGNLFSCLFDVESSNNELNVKICSSLTDPEVSLKMACGHRSQNFLDEVFRAAQIANETPARDLPWLSYYEDLQRKSKSAFTLIDQNHQADERIVNDEFASNKQSDGEEEELVGVSRDSLAKGGMSSPTARDSALKSYLRSKKDQYTDTITYTFLIGTWNVNGQSPGSICLTDWLGRTAEPPDFYAVAFQELDLSKEAFLFNDSPKELEWLNAVKNGLHKGGRYKKVKLVRLIGMMLIFFAKEDLHHLLKNVVAEYVGTGLLGKMGNKGGVGIRFEIEETSFCLTNCHLAAHVEEYQRRNQDFNQISTRLVFYLPDGGSRCIKDHDITFWFGDMNYRIDSYLEVEKAKKLIEKEKYNDILKYDQLKEQMNKGAVFAEFQEGQINFRPTYKYDPGTSTWDSSEKNRSPAWCDRILWKGELAQQLDYVSTMGYVLSDHKPVSSIFNTKVKRINQLKYRRSYEDTLKQLDRLENEYLPHVTVDIPGTALAPHSNRNEIHFGNVKFMEPVKKLFTVANTGQVPVHLEFIKKLNDSYICKDWLRIAPITSTIFPGDSCEIELEILVDKRCAGNLNVGKDNLYDILVLHLENGKDIFITVAADFERSIFGCSITALVNMKEPIKNVTPGKLIELEKGRVPVNTYDIPKELWFLVDHLYKFGMEKEYLFSQSGLVEEILQIRDWLDDIPSSPVPGNTDSIAETLLLLLESFPEPVIPFHLHLKCLDSSSNYALCKQLVKQLPIAHRNVFVYLCAFLRELVKHSEKNNLDANVLASLFGKVMLRDQNFHMKPNQKTDRKKATFIYQFLVNDDTEDNL